MTFFSLLFLTPSILSGSLLVHAFWRERHPFAILLKLSLGIGIGLGINSMLFFASLLINPGKINTLAIEIVFAGALLGVIVLQERRQPREKIFFRLTRSQWMVLALTAIATVFSTLAFFNVFHARPQGAFDAWNVWNRAARFIYRDPENWTAAISPDLHILAHADYPLLVPLNVAWLWSMLGEETQRAPMVQGLLFFLAANGTMFSMLALRRTIAQAGLAALILLGTSVFVYVSAVLIADTPVAYYIFASSALLFLFFVEQKPFFLALSGFMAGLAAWTKNEGLMFVMSASIALILFMRAKKPRLLAWYLAGLIIPLAVTLYFKSIAPSTELLAGDGGIMAKITDPSRYWQVAREFGKSVLTFDDFWPVSSLLILAVYGLFMRASVSPGAVTGLYALGVLIALQLMGYFAIYMLTPYDLEWHLVTSLDRLLLHLYPTFLFLFFNVISPPEEIFGE